MRDTGNYPKRLEKTFSFTKIVIKSGPVGNISLTKLVEVLFSKMQANNELQLLKDWKLLHVHFYMDKITKASENDYDMKKPRWHKQKKVYSGVWKLFSNFTLTL